MLARITDAGRARMAEVAKEHSQPMAGAGREHAAPAGRSRPAGRQAICRSRATSTWSRKWSTGLETGEFPLAALVMPATVDHIRTISEHGERMPAKSTYFYPKLLSGLVINPLE